jgi:hypothetical protein
LIPVLATGERRPLGEVLLRGLAEAVKRHWGGRGAKPRVAAQVEKASARASKGDIPRGGDIVQLFEAVAGKVSESQNAGSGLLVVLDEAGKILEHASANPDQGDLQLLQELAEAANRSGSTPIVLVVMMHQAFEQYAARLSVTERNEWAKVQGRFEDVAFLEGSGDIVRLIGEAIQQASVPKPLRTRLRSVTSDYAQASGAADDASLTDLLSGVFPLSPVTALLLGPLFRSRLAQNERSLFAFLSSSEPHGFQDFLQGPVYDGKALRLLTPDVLYDYVNTSLAGQLYGHLGRQWAQIEVALRRLPEGTGRLEFALLKTIGLLGMFGDSVALPASPDVLVTTFAATGSADEQTVREALDRLRLASLIVFRKFRNAFQLWEGSDIDLDVVTRDALQQIDVGTTLLRRMDRVAPPRPIVARRHLFETGTFRYFDVRYVDVASFDAGMPEADPNADGTILLVIEPNPSARSRLAEQLRKPMSGLWETADTKPILIGIPDQIARLVDAGSEIAALDWVQTHTPELNDDPVARRELAGRLSEAERMLQEEVLGLLGSDAGSVWIHRGKLVTIQSQRALASFLSDVCDDAYTHCPVIHNELVNRRQLSSAAAAARRTLMEAMVLHGSE